MPTFHFQGRNKQGELVEGKRLAQSSDALGAQLLNEGLIPIQITPILDSKNFWSLLKTWWQSSKVSVEDLGIFARQMHTLTKTGVPITSALKQLADNTHNPPVAKALYGIVEHLEAGHDLASSMQYYPDVFTPIMVSMIRVGQNSGHLDEAFLRLNQYLELEASALKRVKTAMRYPIIILSTVIVGIVLINIFVIPTFARIFTQANVPLPWMTVGLISISLFFSDNWIFILIVTAVMIGSLWYYLRTKRGKYLWDQYQLRIPVVGKILKRTMLLRFAQSFSVVIHSGISILEGMDLVARSIHNEFAREKILAMREAIQHGKTLTQAASNINMFTSLELQMLSVSEETGELDKMFEQIAVYYRREVEYDLKRLSDIIEPTLIVILSIMILMLAFAVYLPIWNMIKLVHT